MEQREKIYSVKNLVLTNYSVYVQVLRWLQFWFDSHSSGVLGDTLLLGTTAVYATQYDSSEDESNPASSDLESEDDNENNFFLAFSCNYSGNIVDTYSSLHQLL